MLQTCQRPNVPSNLTINTDQIVSRVFTNRLVYVPINTHSKLLDALFAHNLSYDGLLAELQDWGYQEEGINSGDLLMAMERTDQYTYSPRCRDSGRDLSESEYFQMLATALNDL